MPKIQILPEELINQIAAGEVVERPASVAKELVENSLDAGATGIEIEIRDGGRKLIRVVDNGCGMYREDVQLAFSRHATSKISSLADLHQIYSLGFRGEALPSIASVSRVELVTKTADEAAGTVLKIEAGQISLIKDSPANTGTSISVSDLFYSTPARRKFLKSQVTETRHIIGLVTNFALAFPEVSYRLTSESREIFHLKQSENLKAKIAELFGSEVVSKLIEFRQAESILQIYGFLGKPELSKSSRSDIRFFVNQRSINSRTLLHALTSAYGEMLTKGRFPLAILFLKIPPQLVDVNVHPQKLEVRFQDERGVHDLLFRTVKKALDREFQSAVKKSVKSPVTYQSPGLSGSAVREEGPQYRTGLPVQPLLLKEIFSTPQKDSSPVKKELSGPALERANFYQLFNTYILTQTDDELMIVDQHAAHERVLYEEIWQSISFEKKISTQRLLFPETVQLDPREYDFLESNQPLLERVGFEVRSLSGRTVIVSAVPAITRQGSAKLFKEVLEQFIGLEEDGQDKTSAIASALACRAAVKSGDSLSGPEMQALLQSLLSLKTPQVCPHGRPTLIRIPISELERRFGRS